VLKFAPYVLKGLWRHRARTLLTVSGTAVALFVFAFVQAVQEGLARLTDDVAAGRSLVAFQANRFCPSTSKLPQDYAERVRKLPGVADAVPIKVFMNNCRASLDVVVFQGMPAEKVREARALTLLSGDWARFEGRRDAALVGRAIARRRGLAVGQRFSIGAVTVTVAGVFAAANPTDENFLFTHLEFLQRTPGLRSVGTVTQLEVRLADGADATAVAKAIDDMFRGGPVATDTRPKGAFQARAVGDLVELIGLLRYLGYACVGLVLSLVATTTLMAVQDRVREHAVLQTLGYSGPRIFTLVIAESVIQSLAGGLLGLAAAVIVLATAGLAVGTEGVLIGFAPSVGVVLTGLAVTACVGVAAGVPSAWQAARADIVTALREA
jgi:putative ABC transport system permease protein